jgi:hypothetical protein
LRSRSRRRTQRPAHPGEAGHDADPDEQALEAVANDAGRVGERHQRVGRRLEPDGEHPHCHRQARDRPVVAQVARDAEQQPEQDQRGHPPPLRPAPDHQRGRHGDAVRHHGEGQVAAAGRAELELPDEVRRQQREDRGRQQPQRRGRKGRPVPRAGLARGAGVIVGDHQTAPHAR